ncbi:MAG: hypothetical protein ACREB5_06435 [Sphingomonadaceae bacterium]
MAVVIANDELGVLVGTSMGFAFWTKLDSAGQDFATTFPSEGDAVAFLNSWPEGAVPIPCRFVEVGSKEYVSVADLKDAGLADLLGDMQADALRNETHAGTA